MDTADQLARERQVIRDRRRTLADQLAGGTITLQQFDTARHSITSAEATLNERAILLREDAQH